MHINELGLLRLLQLADSALPIGATAHSFGLENLAATEDLSVERLETFLRDYLDEAGLLESVFCRLAYLAVSSFQSPQTEPEKEESGAIAQPAAQQYLETRFIGVYQEKPRMSGDFALMGDQEAFLANWLAINERASAIKCARESRVASATLGRRLLQLVLGLEPRVILQQALRGARAAGVETHYSSVFGLVGRVLEIDEDALVAAYLQQFLTGLVSACQRMMPLGQSQASGIIWRLKPTLSAIVGRSEEVALKPDDISMFTALPDLGSMCHPTLTTRLFIS
jgi:urease accessory protein